MLIPEYSDLSFLLFRSKTNYNFKYASNTCIQTAHILGLEFLAAPPASGTLMWIKQNIQITYAVMVKLKYSYLNNPDYFVGLSGLMNNYSAFFFAFFFPSTIYFELVGSVTYQVSDQIRNLQNEKLHSKSDVGVYLVLYI